MLLPIYENIEQQFRFRNNCQLGEEIHSFKVPNYMLPSFFFKREKRVNAIGLTRVYNINGTLAAAIPTADLLQVSSPEFDGIGYVPKRINNILAEFASVATNDEPYENYLLPCGKYYYELHETFNGRIYYSEVFEVVDKTILVDSNELVLNGGFDVDLANWVTSGSWAVTSGKAVYSGGGTSRLLAQTITDSGIDDIHFYQFTVTISNYNDSGDATRYLRAFCEWPHPTNSIYINGNGTYTFYFTGVHTVALQAFNGDVTFKIDNISIKKVVGAEEYVSMLLSQSCKFPNSIQKEAYNFFNYFLFDAKILQPEYGEVLKEDENGDFEKTLSFVRPFKKHQMTPLLLPEPVADALAQLNTFDIVEIYDADRQDSFLLNSTKRLTQFRSIQSFETKFEWQENGCYMLSDISFEENLALFDKCCDDAQEVCPCFNAEQKLQISVSFVAGRFLIESLNGDGEGQEPFEGAECAMVRLSYTKGLLIDYVDCHTLDGVYVSAGISVPYSEFLENGIAFYVNDADTTVYKFLLTASQVGCDDECESNLACAGGHYINSFDGCSAGDTFFAVIKSIIGVSTDGDACTMEFYDTNGSLWRAPSSYSFGDVSAVADGASTKWPTFTTVVVPNTDTLTKVRLNFGGGNYSNAVSFSTLAVCE